MCGMARSLDRSTFKKAQGRSDSFIHLVEQHVPLQDASAQDGVSIYVPRIQLPEDLADRKRTLVNLYTGTALYGALNHCLLHDDEAKMRPLAGYIKELRDVFRLDAAPQVIVPFQGRVYRGITVGNPSAVLEGFKAGEEFLWAAFTSTSLSRPFGGNVRFEIQCSLAVECQAAKYVPAQVTHLSQFVAENEVLFPPHVRFRVVGVKGSTVQLEAIEYPDVWEGTDHVEWVAPGKSRETGTAEIGKRQAFAISA